MEELKTFYNLLPSLLMKEKHTTPVGLEPTASEYPLKEYLSTRSPTRYPLRHGVLRNSHLIIKISTLFAYGLTFRNYNQVSAIL